MSMQYTPADELFHEWPAKEKEKKWTSKEKGGEVRVCVREV
jgi:hypothetical protein